MVDDARILELFAPAPKGMEEILAAELTGLGAIDALPVRAGVGFRGSLAVAYRACLWSRLASRILLRLMVVPAPDTDTLYESIRTLDWWDHIPPDGTLAVTVTSIDASVGHTHFAALRVKDAVVDQMRERWGRRPSVDLVVPDVRINIHLRGAEAMVNLDLSGESLHRRHYREAGAQVEAPLKEQLAAAILIRAGWPRIAAEGGPLLDPLCGSGTLLIEGGLMAGDIAPGLLGRHFGFLGWRGHDPELWAELLEEARDRWGAGCARIPPILGCDEDPRAVHLAQQNAARAGLKGQVAVVQRGLPDLVAPTDIAAPGLVVANPPYGERLGSVPELRELYGRLGARLRNGFPSWQAGIFTANEELARELGLRAHRRYTLYNGSLRCRLYLFALGPDFANRPAAAAATPAALGATTDASAAPTPAQAASAIPPFGDTPAPTPEELVNRLRKNLRTVGKWAKREGITCYRLYDADLPDYAMAIDRYEDRIHVQEYEAPATVDPQRAAERLRAGLAVIPEVLDVPPDHVALKVRRRQRGSAQYQRQAETGEFHEVHEGGLRFLVSLTDYLDTGLFLDHRPTRALIRSLADGRDVLNLFGYTGAATVYAAAGGARSTTTIDLSRTYLDWARRNLELNGFPEARHHFLRDDCLAWLEERGRSERFGLIFLDPPTFSTSKGMTTTLDVQRDHVPLILNAARLLTPDGILLFSTSRRRFVLDRRALPDLAVQDITAETIPRDFARHPRVHQCWRMTRNGEGRAT